MSTTNDGDIYTNNGYADNPTPDNRVYEGSNEVIAGNRMVAHRSAWSPVQIVNLIIGIVFTVVGAIALTRSGVNFGHAPATRASVMGLHFTSLSALVVLGIGALLAFSAAVAFLSKTFAWLFGVSLLASGIIIAMTPKNFERWWRFDVTQGVSVAVAGAVLLLGAALSPTFVQSSETSDRRTVIQARRHQPTL